VKEKINLMFKDKLFLVMLVLGLLTIVAAAGVVTMKRGDGQEQNPYVDMQGQENLLAGDTIPESKVSVAGESNAQPVPEQTKEKVAKQGTNQDTVVQEKINQTAGSKPSEDAQAVGTGVDSAKALVLDFSDTSRVSWPVMGNVVLDYSMDSTIYFPTLDQYKCNPGLVIQGEVSSPVYAPANGRVTQVGVNEEIGNYVTLELGNEYTAICGQLKEVTAVEGEYLEKGQLLGYVAEPTKYYTIEGSNVYFQMNYHGAAIDPLDYLE
jgi:murein DD-endopeptidase MepM/ murein hydrolase activator NlpD